MLGELLDHRDHPSTDGRMAVPPFDDHGSESLSPPAKQRDDEHVPGVREERCESRIRVGVDGMQELARAHLPGSRHRPVDPDRDVGGRLDPGPREEVEVVVRGAEDHSSLESEGRRQLFEKHTGDVRGLGVGVHARHHRGEPREVVLLSTELALARGREQRGAQSEHPQPGDGECCRVLPRSPRCSPPSVRAGHRIERPRSPGATAACATGRASTRSGRNRAGSRPRRGRTARVGSPPRPPLSERSRWPGRGRRPAATPAAPAPRLVRLRGRSRRRGTRARGRPTVAVETDTAASLSDARTMKVTTPARPRRRPER